MLLSRVYASVDDASAAVDDLKQAGFTSNVIHLIDQGAPAATVRELVKMGVLPRHAPGYVAAITAGSALLIVEPQLGDGTLAARLLLTPRVGENEQPVITYEFDEDGDESTPFSTLLGWPTLLKTKFPFSEFWNMKMLSDRVTATGKSFGLSFLTSEAAPFSKMLGLKLATISATPFSDMIGMKFSTASATPFSSMLGMKTASMSATPFSAMLGFKTIIKSSTPFSSATGMPTRPID
jgi:hypothetical protein